MRYVCPVCGYIYDEEKEGVAFDSLPDSWVCPLCGEVKGSFRPEQIINQKNQEVKSPRASVNQDIDAKKYENNSIKENNHEDSMIELTAGQLAALCSNLARGCEKQYMNEAALEYKNLANYFDKKVLDTDLPDLDSLKKLLQMDLDVNYQKANQEAKDQGDRGALRALTWNEKVSKIINSVLLRYERDGEDFLDGTNVWVCTVCGFIYIGDVPPDLCPVCKVPNWKFEKIEGRN